MSSFTECSLGTRDYLDFTGSAVFYLNTDTHTLYIYKAQLTGT